VLNQCCPLWIHSSPSLLAVGFLLVRNFVLDLMFNSIQAACNISFLLCHIVGDLICSRTFFSTPLQLSSIRSREALKSPKTWELKEMYSVISVSVSSFIKRRERNLQNLRRSYTNSIDLSRLAYLELRWRPASPQGISSSEPFPSR
jgi:hypothetical protein